MIEAIIAVVSLLVGVGAGFFLCQQFVGSSLRSQREELTKLRESQADLSTQMTQATERSKLGDVFQAERDLAREETNDLRAQLLSVSAELSAVRAERDARVESLSEATARHQAELLRLQDQHREDQRKYEAQLNERLAENHAGLKATFENMAGQVVQKAQEDFLKISGEKAQDDLEKRKVSIESMLEPITKELAEVRKVSQEIDKDRHASFEMLGQGIQAIQKETDRLATALAKPQSRGAWGEMQLELTLTNAGLIEGQDFIKQDSTSADDGPTLRSDFVINLPHGRKLVIDCKLPLTAYMEAMNATDDIAREHGATRHVDAVRGHVRTLSSKAYQDRYPGADCVILFIPHEGAYNLALERDPNISNEAERRKVYLAGPHSILAVVHLARYILNQTRVRDNAEKLSELGERMIERIATVTDNLQSVGRGLSTAIGAYNKTVASVDVRLMPAARQMESLGVKMKKELPELAQVDELPRPLASLELQPALTSKAESSDSLF